MFQAAHMVFRPQQQIVFRKQKRQRTKAFVINLFCCDQIIQVFGRRLDIAGV